MSRFYLQEFLWEESLQAVRDSLNFNSFTEFHHYLETSLPQNSEYTRKRYARNVINWFFPEHSLESLLTESWAYYQDDDLLKQLMRYKFLSVEPLIAEFVTDCLLPAELGTSLNSNIVNQFVHSKYGSLDPKIRERLINTVRRLGFIQRNNNDIIIAYLPPAKTALFLLVHSIFAPFPQVVPLREIRQNPFWKYLGFRDYDQVRKVLKEAEANNLLARYVIADELEQIVTKYRFEEILESRIYL